MAKRLTQVAVILCVGLMSLSFGQPLEFPLILKMNQTDARYTVKKLEQAMVVDGIWEKSQWQKAETLKILNNMGKIPHFFPGTQAKLLYDEQFLYGIFKVDDHYVKCEVEETHGPVYTDSCVEFFFSPDENNPLYYFNLEINCGGVALMQYSTEPHKKFIYILPSDVAQIEIAHSLPKKVFPEMEEEVTWTIEFKIPFSILVNYSEISTPNSGVVWKGNFYKTASQTSNPHYITWAKIDRPKPDFHLPQYFGDLIFQ